MSLATISSLFPILNECKNPNIVNFVYYRETRISKLSTCHVLCFLFAFISSCSNRRSMNRVPTFFITGNSLIVP